MKTLQIKAARHKSKEASEISEKYWNFSLNIPLGRGNYYNSTHVSYKNSEYEKVMHFL